jgi:hypothetical protein
MFAEYLPKHGDVLSQVALFNERVGPDCLHQFVLANHPSGILHQHQQGAEHFGGQRDYLILAE